MKSKLLIIIAALFATSASANAQVIPAGHEGGLPFRYVFVTSTTRDALSEDIADYNAFVNTAAANNSALSAYNFNAIASTNTVQAIDNTGTNAGGDDIPIYLLDGTQVATGNSDLWDGSIAAAINVDENLVTDVNGIVWTGSFTDGTNNGSFGLGQNSSPFIARVGFSEFADDRWILDSTPQQIGTSQRFYGLSDAISVPEPMTPALLLLAGLGLTRFRRRVI